jgi:hypothetical protein
MKIVINSDSIFHHTINPCIGALSPLFSVSAGWVRGGFDDFFHPHDAF